MSFFPGDWTLWPLGVALGWWFVTWTVARLGGWHALARDFRVASRPREGIYEWINTGDVGTLGSYRGCLIVGVTPGGLYLAVWPLVRPGHPPLLIPWGAVRRRERKRVFWSESLLLTIEGSGGRSPQTVQLYGRDMIARVEAQLWTLPPPLPPG